MYNKQPHKPTTLTINHSYVGETIEDRVRRIMNNKEPIKNEASLIYTSTSDGVKPEYDIRADKWEIAVEAMDKVQQIKHTARQKKKEEGAKVVDMQPTQTTDKNTSDGQQQPSL